MSLLFLQITELCKLCREYDNVYVANFASILFAQKLKRCKINERPMLQTSENLSTLSIYRCHECAVSFILLSYFFLLLSFLCHWFWANIILLS